MNRRRSPQQHSPAAWLVVACVAVSGCAGTATASQGLHPGGYRAGDGAVKIIPAAHRVTAPDLSGADLTNRHIDTAQFRGNVVVINFWASWCAPCVAEAPTFAQVARDLTRQGVQFLGVDFRNDDRGNALAFEHRYQIGYPSLYDPSSATVLAMPVSARPVAIPTTVILDRGHRVAAIIYGGPVLYSTLAPLVRQIAAETS